MEDLGEEVRNNYLFYMLIILPIYFEVICGQACKCMVG